MYKILSLFANVGIGELGLNSKKFKVVLYNELIEKRAAFYHYMFPKTKQIIGDINLDEIKNKIIKESLNLNVDFIMITPPCQGFSIAGKRDENDPRNKLIFNAIDIAKKIQPKYIFIENVPQYFNDEILYKKKKILIPNMINNEFKNNYHIKIKILNAKDYGVPQNRKRGFILLSRKDQKTWNFPKKHKKIITVRDAISHLPSIEPIIKDSTLNNKVKKVNILHHNNPRHVERQVIAMKHTPTGKSAHKNKIYFPKRKDGKRIRGFSTTYKRMEWDHPAPAITMMNGSISSQNNVHPGKKMKDGTYSDSRVLTLREIFILSSISPDWDLPNWASEHFVRQVIGEGIPPKLVKEIFSEI